MSDQKVFMYDKYYIQKQKNLRFEIWTFSDELESSVSDTWTPEREDCG